MSDAKVPSNAPRADQVNLQRAPPLQSKVATIAQMEEGMAMIIPI